MEDCFHQTGCTRMPSKIVAKICSNFRLGSLGDEQADIQSDPQFEMG